MRSGTIAWLLGSISLCYLPSLPAFSWLGALVVILVMAAQPSLRPLRILMFALVGFAWTGWHASAQIDTRDRFASLPRDVLIEGTVSGIPNVGRRRARFEVHVTRVHTGERWLPIGGRWRVDWYDATDRILAGQRWRLPVRRSTRSLPVSPGGYDLSKHLFRRNIAATAYIRADEGPELLGLGSDLGLDRVRQGLSELIATELEGRPLAGLVAALAVGDRQRLTNDQRSVLADTGTAHLVAISGLHIGLVAAFGLLLGASVWRTVPALVARIPAPIAGGAVAFLGAGAYAALAGFALPTQRALIMLSVAVAALLSRRPLQTSRALAAALLLTLIVDPLAPMDPGFWLSFGAVSSILWMFAGRLHRMPPTAAWLKLQWGLLLFMLPTGLALFGQVVPAAFLANLVAVPWVSVTVIPPVLAATGMAVFGMPGHAVLYELGEGALEMLWPFLEWMAHWGGITGTASPGWVQVSAALLGVAMLLAPKGAPGRALGVVLLAPALIPGIPLSSTGVSVAILGSDGFAPVVVTGVGSTVLVDAGRQGRWSSDPGRALVLPYMGRRGISELDAVVLTGIERSRNGGLRTVRESSSDARVFGPDALVGHVSNLEPCGKGPAAAAAPLAYDFPDADANRCPVRIRVMNKSVLIPGPAAADADWWRRADVPNLLVLDKAAVSTLPASANRILEAAATVFVKGENTTLDLRSAHHAARCGSLEWRLDAEGSTKIHCHAASERRFWHRTR